jgi:hypothetical protein
MRCVLPQKPAVGDVRTLDRIPAVYVLGFEERFDQDRGEEKDQQ